MGDRHRAGRPDVPRRGRRLGRRRDQARRNDRGGRAALPLPRAHSPRPRPCSRARRTRRAAVQATVGGAGRGARHRLRGSRSRRPARRARARPDALRVTRSTLASLRARHGGIRLRPTLRGGLIVHRGIVALFVSCAALLLTVATAGAAGGGERPISLTVHEHILYVLNAGGAGNIIGFVVEHGALSPLAGSTQPLGAGSSGPAQVSFTPNGKVLVVTEKSSSTIDTYVVAHGIAGPPTVSAAVGGTPFGFDFDKHGNVLTSNATGSASSYDVAKGGSLFVISGAVPTFQGAPCWLVASKNGRYAYTANAGSGTISGFSVDHDGTLVLLDPSGISGNLGAGSHPLDESVSQDGHFLHVLVDGTHSVGTFRIAHDGSLAFVGAIGGLPAGAMGLAAD